MSREEYLEWERRQDEAHAAVMRAWAVENEPYFVLFRRAHGMLEGAEVQWGKFEAVVDTNMGLIDSYSLALMDRRPEEHYRRFVDPDAMLELVRMKLRTWHWTDADLDAFHEQAERLAQGRLDKTRKWWGDVARIQDALHQFVYETCCRINLARQQQADAEPVQAEPVQLPLLD